MTCSARRHGTRHAYWRYGCRCPAAVTANSQHRAALEVPGQLRHATHCRDPFVDETAVDYGRAGQRISLTVRERAAVVHQLSAAKVSAGEIARRLGMSRRHVYRIRADQAQTGRAA